MRDRIVQRMLGRIDESEAGLAASIRQWGRKHPGVLATERDLAAQYESLKDGFDKFSKKNKNPNQKSSLQKAMANRKGFF